ncbi:dnaJ homolog subfamily B member 9-like [Drosophila obscura]|uniref:dnaJ homolog subfamily B member 9-like n=1 Tax=Drosophila obscura TaxID=7282 RepID=UPI001BB20A76|nr:dnaJ homolog subfamily B member 9-like [Drosophila obscura]
MIAYQDHYSVLEVKSCATFQEIKKAYHKMALRYHPDKNKGGEEQFKKVDWAYRVLKDPQKRTEFDQIYKQNKKHNNYQNKSEKPKWKNPPKSSHDDGFRPNSSNTYNNYQNKSEKPKWKNPPKSNHDDGFRPNSSNTYNNYQNKSEKPKWKNPPKSSHDDGFGPNYSYTYNTYHKESEKPKEPPKLKMALIIGGSMVFAYLTYKIIQNRRAASAAEMVMVAISKDNIVEPLEAASATIKGISKIGKWTTGSPNADSSSTFAISAAISKVGSAFAKGISNIRKWTTRSPNAHSSSTFAISAAISKLSAP